MENHSTNALSVRPGRTRERGNSTGDRSKSPGDRLKK